MTHQTRWTDALLVRLLMLHGEGLPPARIAQRLGVPVGAVRSQLRLRGIAVNRAEGGTIDLYRRVRDRQPGDPRFISWRNPACR